MSKLRPYHGLSLRVGPDLGRGLSRSDEEAISKLRPYISRQLRFAARHGGIRL